LRIENGVCIPGQPTLKVLNQKLFAGVFDAEQLVCCKFIRFSTFTFSLSTHI
jgi:hypothetical protein